MFDLSEKRLAWITVSWPGLVQRDPDSLAEPVNHAIELQVELVDQEVVDKLGERFEIPELAGDPAELTLEERAQRRVLTKAIEVDSMLELVHGWRGVLDRGDPVPFDKGSVARMVRVPGFGGAFNLAYAKALIGKVEEREKNFEGSRPDGQGEGPAVAALTE